jgi:hypothetical protein
MSKPPLAQSNDFINKLYAGYDERTAEKPIKIALISDLHVDYGYLEGMSNDCNLPICCRQTSGFPQLPENVAGKWGDFNCDIPQRTLESMLDFIQQEI